MCVFSKETEMRWECNCPTPPAVIECLNEVRKQYVYQPQLRDIAYCYSRLLKTSVSSNETVLIVQKQYCTPYFCKEYHNGNMDNQ